MNSISSIFHNYTVQEQHPQIYCSGATFTNSLLRSKINKFAVSDENGSTRSKKLQHFLTHVIICVC